ncbi:MAG: hypothetical protein QM709_09840 [Spongiibacteraceae bacterium]
MRLIEGVISQLHVERGSQNLLKRIKKNYKAQSVATGITAVASDMFGQLANSSLLATYGGEETQDFACLLDGKLLYGQFAGAEHLREGNRVKVVVEKTDDGIMVAQAIMDEEQGLLWTLHAWGARAELYANFKLAFGLCAFALVFLTIVVLVTGIDSKSIDFLKFIYVAGPLICLGMALWANKDMAALSDPATEIFHLFGFKNPSKVALRWYCLGIVKPSEIVGNPERHLSEYQKNDVYCYKKAIEAGKVSME